MLLEEQIRELAPWYFDVQVTEDISVKSVVEHVEGGVEPVKGLRPQVAPSLDNILKRLYGNALDNRRFLDCGCNCGAYSFRAADLGMITHGFDVREHWIKQALWLKENRAIGNSSKTNFTISHLDDYPFKEYDVAMFGGLFYHLSDPVASLKKIADATEDAIIMDTAVHVGEKDGFLKLKKESTENLMSGVHGLSWLPTGPKVVTEIFRWLGFEHVESLKTVQVRPDRCRTRFLATRRKLNK